MKKKAKNTHNGILDILRGGDLRSKGRSDELAWKIINAPELFPEIFSGICSDDPVVRMRAADCIEKITRVLPGLLAPFKSRLINEISFSEQQEVRWHLAQIFPRLDLTGEDISMIKLILYKYLDDKSSIVRTFSMQALADLIEKGPFLKEEIIGKIKEAIKAGSPAVKARGKKLIAILEIQA